MRYSCTAAPRHAWVSYTRQVRHTNPFCEFIHTLVQVGESCLRRTRPSGPSVASRRRAAHARWPTSVLAVGRDPLGALMATLVAAAASAAMGVSPRCSQRVAIMSDESAELLQLDPERYVTARSCVELKHARVTADSAGAFLFSRWFTLCMLLIRAPHVLCTQQHSRLSSGRSVPLVVHDTEASNYSSPHTSPGAKGASSIYSGAAAKHEQTRASRRLHSFTVTLCVRTTNLIARPRLCTSQVSSQASRACVAGYVRAAMGARSHGWARGSRWNRLCPCLSMR